MNYEIIGGHRDGESINLPDDFERRIGDLVRLPSPLPRVLLYRPDDCLIQHMEKCRQAVGRSEEFIITGNGILEPYKA